VAAGDIFVAFSTANREAASERAAAAEYNRLEG